MVLVTGNRRIAMHDAAILDRFHGSLGNVHDDIAPTEGEIAHGREALRARPQAVGAVRGRNIEGLQRRLIEPAGLAKSEASLVMPESAGQRIIPGRRSRRRLRLYREIALDPETLPQGGELVRGAPGA